MRIGKIPLDIAVHNGKFTHDIGIAFQLFSKYIDTTEYEVAQDFLQGGNSLCHQLLCIV